MPTLTIGIPTGSAASGLFSFRCAILRGKAAKLETLVLRIPYSATSFFLLCLVCFGLRQQSKD